MQLRVLSFINRYAITYVGTSTTAYAQLSPLYPSLYPLCHSRDKLFQALSRFSVLQAMESLAGPRNVARKDP